MEKIYSVYDKVAKRYLSLSFAPNDETFIRTSLYSILMDYPLKDIDIRCLGEFDNDSGAIVVSDIYTVDMTKYVFPRTRMGSASDSLSLDEIDVAAKATKSKIVDELSKHSTDNSDK